jgi:hypothetical protein
VDAFAAEGLLEGDDQHDRGQDDGGDPNEDPELGQGRSTKVAAATARTTAAPPTARQLKQQW